jgi:predicted porin
MKKALIPAAILLTLAGAAHAELSLYGLIDLSYGKNELVGDTKADFHSGGDNGSSQGNSTTKFGLKGSTDVGSGLKANFKLESAGITSNGSVGSEGTAFFNRQAWAGLSGSFGEVRLGRQDSVAFQTMAGFDANGAANAASAFVNAGVAAYNPGRQSHSLQYISPEVNGLKAQLGFKPTGTETATDAAGTVHLPKANYSLGVTYTMGDFAAAVAAESKRYEQGASFASVSASYDLKVAKLMASYAKGGKSEFDAMGKGFGIGVVAPVAGFNVGVNFGRNNDTQAKATEVFVNREVLKNTIAYIDLGRKTVAGTQSDAFAIGAIYTF